MESENKWYPNTAKDLLLPNTFKQKDEQPYTAGLDDTANTAPDKITELPLEKNLNTAIPVNPHAHLHYGSLHHECNLVT